MNDIRYFMKRGKDPGIDMVEMNNHSDIKDNNTIDTKMNMIRRKMTESRRKMETQNIRAQKKASVIKTWRGKKLIAASDVKRTNIQPCFLPVLVGTDVEALYPRAG